MSLSDSELLMLEQLTYLNENSDLNSTPLTNNKKVGDILDNFSEKSLAELEGRDGDIDGSEWAAMIRYMKKNPNIRNLEIEDIEPPSGETERILFKDSDGNAIVAFRGTVDEKGEWRDNIEGLNRSDTDAQKEALDYINGLQYDDITVVGHSKGGNKAQYVAITSDKVSRCVSMDGQGFSKEFLEKYRDEIIKNAHKIKNYSLSTDYVHVLLYGVPGAEQIYIQNGDDVKNIRQIHSPNSMFEYYMDENGDTQIVLKDGEIYLPAANEDPSAALLRAFTIFVMRNASDSELQEIVEFIGKIMDYGIKGGVEGLVTTKGFETFIAYLIKYIVVNDLGVDDLVQLLEALGIGDMLFDYLKKTLGDILPPGVNNLKTLLGLLLADIIAVFMLGSPASALLSLLFSALGIEIASIIKAYNNIDVKYNPVIVTSSGKITDYSSNTYNMLLGSIHDFQNMSLPGVSKWKAYSGAQWYGKVSAALAIMCINAYADNLEDINSVCKIGINAVFTIIKQIDSNYSNKLQTIRSNINESCAKLDEITLRLS